MKTQWDYTTLAESYLKRPSYSEDVIDEILAKMAISPRSRICDVGAGVAHLTLPLLRRGHVVVAVEPNDAMRERGQLRTAGSTDIVWFEGTGEHTGQGDKEFDLVTFGSSFNVCDRQSALKETARILKPGGWFLCLWNHRDLNDPVQKSIENIIRGYVPDYDYGTRREDQTSVIEASGLFQRVQRAHGPVKHEQTIEECVQAWRSHATVQRQAGPRFQEIIRDIEQLLKELKRESITIPFVTQAWYARLK